MTHAKTARNFTVLLIGNYLPDGQKSMLRFVGLLAEGLRKQKIRTVVFNPPVVVGKLGAKGYGMGKWLGYIDKYLLFPFFLRARIRRIPGPLVVHICDHSNAPYTRWVRGLPHLVTCHDLLAVRSALGEIEVNPVSPTGKQQQAMILRGLKRSRCLVSVSNATRDDVKRLVGDAQSLLHVIPNALDAAFISEATAASNAPKESQAPPSLPERFVMHIGGGKWYKNRSAVIRIFRELAVRDAGLELVVVGPDFSEAELKRQDAAHLKKHIFYMRNLSDAELRYVYKRAELLLFPSLIEGFGWPILEAQACGCPVASLDVAPMNELNATPELLLPADSRPESWPSAAASQCLDFLGREPAQLDEAVARMKHFAAGFTSHAAVERYLSIYEEILNT